MHRSEGDLLLLSEFINPQMCIKIPGNVNGMFIKLAYTLDQKHGACLQSYFQLALTFPPPKPITGEYSLIARALK